MCRTFSFNENHIHFFKRRSPCFRSLVQLLDEIPTAKRCWELPESHLFSHITAHPPPSGPSLSSPILLSTVMVQWRKGFSPSYMKIRPGLFCIRDVGVHQHPRLNPRRKDPWKLARSISGTSVRIVIVWTAGKRLQTFVKSEAPSWSHCHHFGGKCAIRCLLPGNFPLYFFVDTLTLMWCICSRVSARNPLFPNNTMALVPPRRIEKGKRRLSCPGFINLPNLIAKYTFSASARDWRHTCSKGGIFVGCTSSWDVLRRSSEFFCIYS